MPSNSPPSAMASVSDYAPASPLVSDQSTVSIPEAGGDGVPEVETQTGEEGVPQIASDDQESQEVFLDSVDNILPPEDVLPPTPPAGVEEGKGSVDPAPSPAVEDEVEGATLAPEGGSAVEASSPGLRLEKENSGDASAVAEKKVQSEEPAAVESAENVVKDEVSGGGLSEEASYPTPEGAGGEDALEGASIGGGVVEGVEDNGVLNSSPGGEDGEQMKESSGSTFPPAVEQDGEASVVNEGDRGVGVSSQSIYSEKNYEYGGVATDDKVQNDGSLPADSSENAEKDGVLGAGSSAEASYPTSDVMTEKKVVEVESIEMGAVEGVKDNGVMNPPDGKYKASVEMEAPASKGGSSLPVVAESNIVEAEKIEASDKSDSARIPDVVEEAHAQDEETHAADSHDARQIPDVTESLDGGEGFKSGNIKSNVLDPLRVGGNGTLLKEEEEFSADRILGVYETEEAEQDENFLSDGPARVAILESSEAAKQIIEGMEQDSSNLRDNSKFGHGDGLDGEIVVESDEDVDTDEDADGEMFDSAALTALLKAAAGASPNDNITISSQDAGRIFSADPPVGLGSSVSSLKPAAARSIRSSIFSPSELAVVGDDENLSEEEKKLHDKVEQIRVKFLRLVQRLGHSPEDTVAAQVLYRLGLAEGIRRGRQSGRSFSLENAKRKALQLETDGDKDLDFSCNILVLGKSGVGKSATINSIFGDCKSHTNAFEPATSYVKEISGTLEGVKIRIIDTPGLRTSAREQSSNRKILSSIKKFTKRCPPDIVLYVDRLDSQTRDLNDLPLLRSITSTLGSSIWFNAIVALTHAASAPPDGPNGSALSYEMFVAQRSHVVQQCIRQAAGDMRLMNPVALVENHPSCRKNRDGESVLPNGLSWRPQMLLLCYSSKILSEANSLLKLQDSSPGKLFNFRFRSPPLPFLLSSLLQSREHPKISADQGGENEDSDIDLDDLVDANEEEDEYDQLPPFKPLRKAQIAKLTKEQRKAYFEEYDYRVKLLQKKQWKEELRRIKEMKKRGKNSQNDLGYGDMAEDIDQDGAPAAVPVPLPDMALPPSFDCDNPVYRYRFLEPTSQLLTRPVLDTHGWDHDCGYDGVSIEQTLALAGCFPAAIVVQITKDKKEFSIQLDSSISAKHGENGSTLAGFDIQSVGRQLAYILRGETKFSNFKKNKTAGGISVTFLGETIATGLKIEDQITIGKRVNLVASTGAVRAQGDVAFGANLEARLRDKDYPIGQSLSTLGLSLMKWRGDLALGANLQSQLSIGRNSKMAVRVGLNNKLSGQITVKTSSSEYLQIALVGILPTIVSMFRSFWPGESYLAH